jgi:hypothetical protein
VTFTNIAQHCVSGKYDNKHINFTDGYVGTKYVRFAPFLLDENVKYMDPNPVCMMKALNAPSEALQKLGMVTPLNVVNHYNWQGIHMTWHRDENNQIRLELQQDN